MEIVVAGELFVDLILGGFDVWPEPGKESVASEFRREVGGASITACGLARLGVATQVFGVAGAEDGDWLLARLRKRGVDTTAVRLDSLEPTAFTIAATNSRDRAFLTYPGANRRFPAALALAAQAGEFGGVRHVHLACSPDLDTAAGLFEALRKSGCGLSLDAGWQEQWLADPRLLSILPLAGLCFPNQSEAGRITGERDPERALRRFEAAGVARVALKLGAHGAMLLWDGEIFRAAPRDVRPLDPTGAGDCFDAGFLYAWLAGEPPETCLRAANICGALSTEAYGGVEGFPTPERLADEMGRP